MILKLLRISSSISESKKMFYLILINAPAFNFNCIATVKNALQKHITVH